MCSGSVFLPVDMCDKPESEEIEQYITAAAKAGKRPY